MGIKEAGRSPPSQTLNPTEAEKDMHPDILIELARQKHAELIAAGEASRLAARAGGDAHAAPRRLARAMQRRILRPWSRRRACPVEASD
jgi:hypothetical protein